MLDFVSLQAHKNSADQLAMKVEVNLAVDRWGPRSAVDGVVASATGRKLTISQQQSRDGEQQRRSGQEEDVAGSEARCCRQRSW